MDDASTALSAKVRQRGTDQMDRPDQVRRDDVLDLRVCEFLRGAKQAVTGTRHVAGADEARAGDGQGSRPQGWGSVQADTGSAEGAFAMVEAGRTQGEVAELFRVDRSTISRLVSERRVLDRKP